MSRGEHLFGPAPAHRLISQTGHRRVLHPGWQTAACATDIPDVGTNMRQAWKNGNPSLCHKGSDGKVVQRAAYPFASILGEHAVASSQVPTCMNSFLFPAENRSEFSAIITAPNRTGLGSWRFFLPRALCCAGVFFFSIATGYSQKTTTSTFEFPDRTVTVLVPESVKVEQVEGTGIKLTYKVEDGVDVEAPESRLFVEEKITYNTPQKVTTAVLDMAPFDKEAVLHVWNPDERCAYVTFDQNNATIDLNNINYKGAEEKFAGEVKSVAFSTNLSLDPGEHVIEIRKFATE